MMVVSMGILNAQEKYAVLITGDYAATGIPPEKQWGDGNASDSNPMIEFWYDTYLMWEMLVYEKGYDNDKVFVLFANGIDYSIGNSWMWNRYDVSYSHPEYEYITDYSATIANVEHVLTGLRYGTNGFPEITEDDFLFTWVFDHGGNGSFSLLDGSMTDTEYAALVNPIAAHKKVHWMQQCNSGSFVEELEGENAIFLSASQANQSAHVADNFFTDDVTPIRRVGFFK